MIFSANVGIGYSFEVTNNPNNLPPDRVQDILAALLDYAEIPTQEALEEMLECASEWLGGLHDLQPSDIIAYKGLKIQVWVVHRDTNITYAGLT